MTDLKKSVLREVRKFGILFGILAGAAAAFLWYRESAWWGIAAALSLFFFATGFFFRPVLKPVYTAWMAFAHVLGWVNTRVLLTLFFFLVMTPVGVLMRLFGKDFLNEKLDRQARSYWVPRDRKPATRDRYERLF